MKIKAPLTALALILTSSTHAQSTGNTIFSNGIGAGVTTNANGWLVDHTTNSLGVCNVLAEHYYGTVGCPTYAGSYISYNNNGVGFEQALEVDLYANNGATNGDQAVILTPTMVADSGGGSVWGIAGDNVLKPGWGASASPSNPMTAVGMETDLGNSTGVDHSPSDGTHVNVFGWWLQSSGTNQNTAGLYIDGIQTGNEYGWYDGILLQGSNSIKGNGIVDTTNDQNSIWIGGSHSIDMNITSTANTSIAISGHHVVALSSTGDSATYGLVVNAGQKICFNQLQVCQYYDSSTQKLYWTDTSGQPKMSLNLSTGVLTVLNGVVTGTP